MRSLVLLLGFLIVSTPASADIYGLPSPPAVLHTTAPGTVDCYVNKFAVGATDTANPCGTEGTPRLTIPSGTLAAGTVIAVYGGNGFYDADITITASGTEENPVFIRGVNTGNGFPLFVGDRIGDNFELAGTYLILMDAYIYGARLDFATGSAAVAARNVEVFGNLTTACVTFFGTSGLFTGGRAHSCGDYTSESENDFHGIFVAQGALLTWILDSQIHHNGGDAIQVGNTSCVGETARYTFIGGNLLFEDRENAVDVKCVRDTVIASNVIYGYDTSPGAEPSSFGEAIVAHDEASNVWVVNNFIFSSDFGVVSTESTGFFVFGNILVGEDSDTGDSDPFHSSGILVYNSSGIGIYYNTMYNWNSSLSTPSGNAGSNELIGNIAHTTTYDYRLGTTTFSGGSNLGAATNPLFVAPLSLNYRLQAGSPALDAGTTAPSILAFYTGLYGSSITADIYGVTRSGTYSIGASELGNIAPSRIRAENVDDDIRSGVRELHLAVRREISQGVGACSTPYSC